MADSTADTPRTPPAEGSGTGQDSARTGAPGKGRLSVIDVVPGGHSAQGGTEPAAKAPDATPAAKPAEKSAEKSAGKPAAGGAAPAKDKKSRKNRNAPSVIEIAPAAQPARMRRRHWLLILLFVAGVIAPLAVAGWYLWTRAVDQYASVAGFTVRQEETASATDLLTPILGNIGSSGTADADILYEFIQSQSLVAAIDARLDLVAMYSAPHAQDPIFALAPGATIEDLTDYWSRIVQLSYDQSTGLMEMRVLAFSAEEAQAVAQAILEESQVLINGLNATARADTLRYAEEDLATAEERLRGAREALVTFRTETQIVDPETDVQGRESLINVLQQQLAQALIDYDLLVQSSSPGDPRVTQAESRIAAIRERIEEERQTSVVDGDYPKLIAEYESLTVDREFAEESYRAARAALDSARANASRQTRYLAAFVPPTLPQAAEYPRRAVLFGLTGLFLLLTWAILSLVYYSIRDSR